MLSYYLTKKLVHARLEIRVAQDAVDKQLNQARSFFRKLLFHILLIANL